MKLMPWTPVAAPFIEILRRPTVVLTSPAAVMLTLIAVVPAARIPTMQHPSMVIDLVIVTVPNPPGSSASISPSTAVFEMAPANVLQGAVRLQGLASSPTPDTQVRVAWALAIEVTVSTKTATARIFRLKRSLLMLHSPFGVELNCCY